MDGMWMGIARLSRGKTAVKLAQDIKLVVLE
jgi:hypothetical protein